MKSITSEKRNSFLFFQILLLFFRESSLFFSLSALSLLDLRTDKGREERKGKRRGLRVEERRDTGGE